MSLRHLGRRGGGGGSGAFTDIFIERPVLAAVVAILIIVVGMQAILTLNVRQYPRSENASVTVTTVYIGASADLVRGFITTPLERAIAGADGIDYIESQSSPSRSVITARIKLNYDPTKALAEISSKVDQVRGDLPPEAEVPIINIENADSQRAAAYLRFTSDILRPNEITDYLARVVQPRFSAIPGVQRAEILGGRVFAMRIWLKPERMAALNVSPAQIRQALAGNNYLSAVGQTKGALVTVNLTANTDLSTPEEFEQLVIRESGGAIVRLKDVADVVLGAEDYDSEVRFSGQKAVFMGIWVLPNANSLDVLTAVRKELDAINRDLPAGMKGGIGYDSTVYIQDAIDEVIKTLVETLLIVVAVIFLFLGSMRAVLVPVAAIPLSIIGAFFLMQAAGFTINLLTLLAIVLCVGIVVDDAIVMVENIERHLSEGMKPFEAALKGARELVGPVISMTITLAVVYAPIGFQGGLTGALFREFAFTLAGAVLVSGIVALTVSPVMCAKLFKPGIEERGFARMVNRAFTHLRDMYTRALDGVLSARPAAYFVWVVIALLCIPMFRMSPTELAPSEDQGIIFGIVDAPANATVEETARYAEAANKIFFEEEETEFTFQLTQPSSGFSGMRLKPWSERERTPNEILPGLSDKLQRIAGISVRAVTPPALPGGGNFPVEFVIASTAEPQQILEIAHTLQQKAACSPSRRSSTPRSTNPRRNSSSIATRSPHSASTSAKSARTSRPWSAAITSTASTSADAATRSSRKSSAPAGSIPTSSSAFMSPDPTAVSCRSVRWPPSRSLRNRARSTASSSSTRSSSAVWPSVRSTRHCVSLRTKRPRLCRRVMSSTTPVNPASCVRKATNSSPLSHSRSSSSFWSSPRSSTASAIRSSSCSVRFPWLCSARSSSPS